MKTDTAIKQTPETIYLKDYKAPDFDALSLHLTFDIQGDDIKVTNVSRYDNVGKAKTLKLHRGKYPELESISLNGHALGEDAYTLSNKFLEINCAGQDQFELEIVSTVTPKNNTDLEGIYLSDDMICSQCEAEGFRNITFWQDRPDVMSVFTVRIEADKSQYPVLLSNGNETESGDLGNGRHFVTWHDPHKKPGHLFAIVAGDLEHIEAHHKTPSGRDVTIRIFGSAQDITQVDYAMQAVIDSMVWDEKAYGREYDLDIFNVVCAHSFNSGAMENKSLNIFNSQLVLAHPETATDEDFLRVQRVIAHEYFHNWSGNRVGLRDWFQLSLKEGFTVLRENQFGRDHNNLVTERIDEVKLLRDMQFPEDAGPMAHAVRPDNYIEIRNFYTLTVYEKGSEVIEMMASLLGEDTYRKATDIYFDKNDGAAATVEDFVAAMEDASGQDIKNQFMLWYTQAGTPQVKATSHYDAAAETFTLTFEQTIPDTPGQTNKKPMVIPIRTALLNNNGGHIDLGGEDEALLVVTEKTQKFVFKDIREEPTPSMLRGFSAPIVLEHDLSDAQLRFLMVHDTDGFNRWEAGQRLMTKAILDHYKGSRSDFDTNLLQALNDLALELKDNDKASLARMLSLPETGTLFQAIGSDIDPTRLNESCKALETAIGERSLNLLKDIHAMPTAKGDFETTPEAMAARSLKNVCLGLIHAAAPADGIALAKAQYDGANLMTERVGALKVLTSQTCPEKDDALNDFMTRFADYELVINKWFSLQATANSETIIEDVKALMQHPLFNIKNPNRVRSVIAALCIRNVPAFHHPSGEGYKILADTVITLNTLNAQLASRLLSPFRQWTIFDEARREKMKAELERILATENLSPDVYEVVSKTLKA